jgi:hypothetical protein
MNTTQNEALKTPCCHGNVRAIIDQTALVNINEQSGNIKSSYRFSELKMATDCYWCDTCGEEFTLVQDDITGRYFLSKGPSYVLIQQDERQDIPPLN